MCDRHGTCFDDGVPFFLQIRPDSLSSGRRRRRPKPWFPPRVWFSLSFLYIFLQLPSPPFSPRASSLTFSRQQRILRSVLPPFLCRRLFPPLTLRVTGPYAKWISLISISRFPQPRSWHIIVFSFTRFYFPLGKLFQVSRSLRVKVIPFWYPGNHLVRLFSSGPGRQARG